MEEDMEKIDKVGYYRMLNIRLAKNGGLSKCLALAVQAEKMDLGYALGCHVGETGILSALGRVAASLMRRPMYVDGSYDTILLADNVTKENFSFGSGGDAPIIRGRSLGYQVDDAKIHRYAVAAKAV
jgi:muconate cycloisomerase